MKKFLKKVSPLYRLYIACLKFKQKLYYRLTIPDYEVKRKVILDLAKEYCLTETFVETGTFLGETVDYLKNDFKHLVSIELNDVLASRAKQRFHNNSNVQIMQGDSAVQLSSILSKIESPIVFWLDGHYSSSFNIGGECIVTGRGAKDTPVMEELTQIKNHLRKRSIILIDDARLFNGTNDYPTLKQLKFFVENQLPAYELSVKKDIIRILPKKNNA
jgi:hypothetical protein